MSVDAQGAWTFLTLDTLGSTRTVWVVASGPGLAPYSVTGTISDPQIEVWDQNGDRIAYNDDRPNEYLNAPSYPITAITAKDAAVRLTLGSGVYSIKVSGVGGATGIAVIEVYDLDPQPAFISLASRARLDNSSGVAGLVFSGSGTIDLATLLSGPNLPLSDPIVDPSLTFVLGSNSLGSNDSYTSRAATYGNVYGSPLTGNSRNAGDAFVWTILAGPAQIGMLFGAGKAYLLEFHNLNSTTQRPPVVYVPPASNTLTAGSTLSLQVLTGGELARTIQWQRNGVDIPGAIGPTFTRNNVDVADAGTYRVRVTSSIGTTISPPATIAVTLGQPTITTQPQDSTVTAGQPVTLSVVATGGNLSYQWSKNGANIAGATSSNLTFSSITEADAGNYAVVVTNSVGAATSSIAALTVQSANPTRLINFSLRAFASSGERTLIVGFALAGTSYKPLLVRGIGPGLSGFNVSDFLADPRLGIFSGETEIMTNDNWSSTDGRNLGAFQLVAGSKDAVIANNFNAATFTSKVTGAADGTGEAMVELYDGATTNTSLRLVNLSARTFLGDGQRLIVGFTTTGANSKKLIMRAVGPGLVPFGVTTAHADPRIELYSGDTKIADNDQWQVEDGRDVGAFPLTTGSKDAVLVRTLSPGGYTVHVLGPNGASGVVLVEVYEGQ